MVFYYFFLFELRFIWSMIIKQRMEKERLENALAINFIKMKIDQGVSYVNRLHFREEELIEEIEEDEFPGKLIF